MPELITRTNARKRNTIDGRRWEAKLLARTQQAFVDHVGGRPSVAETALIGVASSLVVRLAAIHRREADDRSMPDDVGDYVALSDALVRVLNSLGLKTVAEPARLDS